MSESRLCKRSAYIFRKRHSQNGWTHSYSRFVITMIKKCVKEPQKAQKKKTERKISQLMHEDEDHTNLFSLIFFYSFCNIFLLHLHRQNWRSKTFLWIWLMEWNCLNFSRLFLERKLENQMAAKCVCIKSKMSIKAWHFCILKWVISSFFLYKHQRGI